MTSLDPEPTIFGTGRIDPLVAPDSSTEYTRAIAWINNRAARMAFGAQLQVGLLGDPIAAYNLRAAYQPLLDWRADLQTSPYEDFEYTDPSSNWGSNL